MDTQIGIISGFLGAGKTTLIRKLLKEALSDEKIVLIENEFGEIGIDGTILKQSGIRVREINSGCICCTLAGDFHAALKDVVRKYRPERILIEPSGVGKLSDILPVCRKTALREQGRIDLCVTVVDAQKYRMYAKNFSEFFLDQIDHAETILFSRTQNADPEELSDIAREIKGRNERAAVITTPWDQLSGAEILSVAEKGAKALISREDFESAEEEHHHHHHDADEAFQVWSRETPKVFDRDRLREAMKKLPQCGEVLRAKGILPVRDGRWVQFDYVPEESGFQEAKPEFTGRLCVIGKGLDRRGLAALFQVDP
ncbi:GTP-binding protein [Caproiciproducens sp. NJN-50]|uniref:CobW family GTP-binding protein n=1 Tax=Acutalibacteraceae TaxID=3082771 RepID=UPI000FFE1D3E|nr:MULTISPECIES: GTP-binding protein [Acutalibacteraceae]QAT50527.1 GTP-binding protein [Caproiciproducens sp. NJN-50]